MVLTCGYCGAHQKPSAYPPRSTRTNTVIDELRAEMGACSILGEQGRPNAERCDIGSADVVQRRSSFSQVRTLLPCISISQVRMPCAPYQCISSEIYIKVPW